MLRFILCLYALFLCSCGQSTGDQIEKCVQSGLQASGPLKSQEKSEAEFQLRVLCLRAAKEKE